MKTTLALFCMTSLSIAADITCFEPKGGISRVVSVKGAALAHTAQLMGDGADLKAQIDSALVHVDAALQSGGSSLAKAVKLNVYVTQNSATSAIEAALAERFKGDHQPAVSFVTTTLPEAKALVAMDAVGVEFADSITHPPAAEFGGRIGSACAVMPVGTRVYISGQAEKGDGTLADATRQTMASLGRTLEFLGLSDVQVVQIKAFLSPMARCTEAEKEISAFYGDVRPPPCVFVEWQSTLPIEIEMIVSAWSDPSALSKGPSVEVRTPPGMTTPAVYSRLTIARHPTTIYTSGLYPADPKAAPEAQLRSLFTNLKQCLDLGGSDWMHLVKATYYVNDDELSKQHNLVRPDYFSPRRPPAASKAVVAGTGRDGQGITMDFVVVPGE